MYPKTALLILYTVFTLSSCTNLVPQPLCCQPVFPYPNLPRCERSSNNEMVPVPGWICTLPEVKTHTGAYGVGIARVGGPYGLQRRRAQNEGRFAIAASTRTQIASNLQKEEVRNRILELSDNNPEISRGEIIAAIDIVIRNIRQNESVVFGSRMLKEFETPDGTIYVLMGTTDAQQIRASAELMIRDAIDVGRLGSRCQQIEKCLNISKLLSTAIDGRATILVTQ